MSQHWRQFVSTVALPASIVFLSLACTDPTASPYNGDVDGNAHVRIINTLFQTSGSTAVGVPIDYLVDSSSSAPGVLNLPFGDLTTGDSANGYTSIPAGIHSFVARVAGNTAANSSVYTTSTNLPYLPKQMLTAGTYYTFLVTGTLPETGLIPSGAVPFVALPDDPFPGPKIGDEYVPRYRFVNAAPYASTSGTGTYVKVFFTEGPTFPVTLNGVVQPYEGFVPYPCAASGCVAKNVNKGQYVITVMDLSTSAILAQQAVTFAAGDVVTVLFLSSGPTGPGNNYLKVIHDHLW